MNLRDIANKVGGYIRSKKQDDKGLIQQGKFTPIRAISNIRPVQGRPTLGESVKTVFKQGINPYRKMAEGKSLSALEPNKKVNYSPFIKVGSDITNQGLKNYISGSTFGLYEPKMGEAQTTAGKITGVGTGLVGSFSSPLSKVVFGAPEKLATAATRKTLIKVAPNIAGSRAARIIPQVTSELAQTGAYAGLSALGSKLGLNERTGQFTPKEFTKDFIRGLAFRAAPNIKEGLFGAKTINKMHPEDITWLDRANDTLRDKKSTEKQINNAKTILYNLAEKYIDQKTLNTIENRPKLLVNRLIKIAGTDVGGGIEPTMGIVSKNQNIKVPAQPEIKIEPETPKIKTKGFVESVQESELGKETKKLTKGEYQVKPNTELMGEAKALLTEGGSIKNIKNVKNVDTKIAAAIQEALNLDASGQHDEAAALLNNLSDLGTELGRGVQSFSLISKMSPEAISLSAAGKIKNYNKTHKAQIPELTGDQQKTISKLVDNFLKLPDGVEKNIALHEINETINSFIPSSIVDKAITVWKAGLLTSLRTHERNLLGNTVMQAGEVAKDVPAVVADKIMSIRTGQRSMSPTIKGTGSGAKQGIEEAVDTMKYGFNPNETLEKFETNKINWNDNPIENVLKKYTDFVFNTLSVEDKPFWQSSYNRSLYDQAATEAINQGKSGDAGFIKKLVKNATENMKITAIKDADYATFHDKNLFSEWATSQKRTLSKNVVGKIVSEMTAPFTGVPSSIVGKTFDYSPLGLIKGSYDFTKVMIKNMPELQRQAAQELGRGIVGSGIFALGGYLMSKGLMTGQPKDAKEAEQWKIEGKQANSLLINGKWRSINSIGPQSLILLAGAKFNEEMGSGGGLGTYGMSLAKDQLSQTFLSGVQQPLQAITDPKRYAGGYVGGQVSSLVPNIVKDASKAFDSTAREVDTGSLLGNVKTSVQSGIPFWRNQMTPRRDTLGNIIKQEPTGVGAFVDLFNSKTPISNTVVDELERLNKEGYSATPSKIQKTQTINGVKMTLDQKDLDYYEQEAGKAVSQDLETLINSPVYQGLDDSDKKDMIDKQVTKTRKQVRAALDLIGMPDMGYKTSADAPKGIVEKAGVYGKSLITDPKQTIKAVVSGNPIRKVEGGIVILERQNALGSLDKGDQATEVDHIIALTLGGTNNKDNLQFLTKEENRAKGAFETYLYKEVKAGRMTKKQAQEKDRNWREEILNMPEGEIKTLSNDIQRNATSEDSLSGLVFKVVSDSGTPAMVDIGSEIEQPEYTGQAELDKKLKSAYKSKITKRINDIVKVYEDGQISAKEAEELINKIKSSQTGTGTKKGKKITIKAVKYDIPKITIKSQKSKQEIIRLKKSPTIKVSSSSNNRKYTIKA